MAKKQARTEGALGGAVKFALVGLVGGIAAGAAFATPIWLTGGAERGAGGTLLALLVGFPLGGLVGGFFVGLVFSEGIGGLVEFSFQGGRGHTKAEYSHIQTMIIRGFYDEAVAACDAAAAEDPRNPEPLLMAARVLRDNLEDYERAAEYLRRASRLPKLSVQQDTTIVRELVDLYEGPLETPQRALPELARIAEQYEGTRAAEWARNATQQIRGVVWSDLKGDEGAE